MQHTQIYPSSASIDQKYRGRTQVCMSVYFILTEILIRELILISIRRNIVWSEIFREATFQIHLTASTVTITNSQHAALRTRGSSVITFLMFFLMIDNFQKNVRLLESWMLFFKETNFPLQHQIFFSSHFSSFPPFLVFLLRCLSLPFSYPYTLSPVIYRQCV